jgi:hypothetical protein
MGHGPFPCRPKTGKVRSFTITRPIRLAGYQFSNDNAPPVPPRMIGEIYKIPGVGYVLEVRPRRPGDPK